MLTVAVFAISLGYIFYNLPALGSGEGELKNLSVVLAGMSILIGIPVMAYLAVKYIK